MTSPLSTATSPTTPSQLSFPLTDVSTETSPTTANNFTNLSVSKMAIDIRDHHDEAPSKSQEVGMNKSAVSYTLASQTERPRRRSSVLRRMSVGSIQQPDNSLKLKIDLHSVSYEHSKIEEDEEDEEENGDDFVFLNDQQEPKEEGPKISDFTPIKVLGKGAYGKVILVKNKTTGQLFAQKELKKASIVVDTKTTERTKSERDILASVTSHQNIVKLFYALHDERKLYLILEYIPGGELFNYLAKERFLSERNASFYVAQMALALKHLHGLGIVYRDLKPENCLLDQEGYLVLTDFGLAKQSTEEDSENWCNSVIGTPEYCSPEVVRGEDYGMKTDWWSLGCVMFDLLTGNPPFTGNNHKAIMDKILKKKPHYPTYISSDSKALLNKLLHKNVDKRFDVDGDWTKFEKMGFFRYFKVSDLMARRVEPPIKPTITDLQKAENFDDAFTNMKLSDLGSDGVPIPQSSSTSKSSDIFSGFSYAASSSFIESYTSKENTRENTPF